MISEGRIRYRAARCGFYLTQTRGLENKRREDAGVGTYMLIDQQTESVALFAATLSDINEFLQDRSHAKQPRLH
jgi:hypothetical protein